MFDFLELNQLQPWISTGHVTIEVTRSQSGVDGRTTLSQDEDKLSMV